MTGLQMAMMGEPRFWTQQGIPVPAVTAEQIREVDRIAVEEFGLGILQMMENAGRNLAANVLDMPGGISGEVTVLAGSGGNGGGGLCFARHLHNRGFSVNLILVREASALRDAAANQLRTLKAAGLNPIDHSQSQEMIRRADIVIDALIGYSLRGAPRGRAAELIEMCNEHASRVLSLDVPSGLDTLGCSSSRSSKAGIGSGLRACMRKQWKMPMVWI